MNEPETRDQVAPPGTRGVVHIFEDPDTTGRALCGWMPNPDLPVHYSKDLGTAECVVCVDLARERGLHV